MRREQVLSNTIAKKGIKSHPERVTGPNGVGVSLMGGLINLNHPHSIGFFRNYIFTKNLGKKDLIGGIMKDNQIKSLRAVNENVMGILQRFKTIADGYRNWRKRFGLRPNLIAGLYNWKIKS